MPVTTRARTKIASRRARPDAGSAQRPEALRSTSKRSDEPRLRTRIREANQAPAYRATAARPVAQVDEVRARPPRTLRRAYPAHESRRTHGDRETAWLRGLGLEWNRTRMADKKPPLTDELKKRLAEVVGLGLTQAEAARRRRVPTRRARVSSFRNAESLVSRLPPGRLTDSTRRASRGRMSRSGGTATRSFCGAEIPPSSGFDDTRITKTLRANRPRSGSSPGGAARGAGARDPLPG